MRWLRCRGVKVESSVRAELVCFCVTIITNQSVKKEIKQILFLTKKKTDIGHFSIQEMLRTWWVDGVVFKTPPGLLYHICADILHFPSFLCSNTELLINAWSSDESSLWRITYPVDPILQMGGAGSAWVFTVDNSTVPGERLGPGESLCDDQRWGRLAPITLILHPLQETSGDAIKTSLRTSCMNTCSSVTPSTGKQMEQTAI